MSVDMGRLLRGLGYVALDLHPGLYYRVEDRAEVVRFGMDAEPVLSFGSGVYCNMSGGDGERMNVSTAIGRWEPSGDAGCDLRACYAYAVRLKLAVQVAVEYNEELARLAKEGSKAR